MKTNWLIIAGWLLVAAYLTIGVHGSSKVKAEQLDDLKGADRKAQL